MAGPVVDPEGAQGSGEYQSFTHAGRLRVMVLSDTHAPRHWKTIPEALREPLAAADLVLHGGDVCTPSVLDELAGFAPVLAVLGNNDGPEVAARGVPGTRLMLLGGVKVAMVHDAGARTGRDRRMRRRFPDAELAVFGHSHIPLDEPDGAVHLFNPGSPTDKRRQPRASHGWLEFDDGQLVEHRICWL